MSAGVRPSTARARPTFEPLSQHPVEIHTDADGLVTAAPERAARVFAVSLRALHLHNLLAYFPADHERLRREVAFAANAQSTERIDTVLYPRERARVAVTIHFDYSPPADAVWVIARRTD